MGGKCGVVVVAMVVVVVMVMQGPPPFLHAEGVGLPAGPAVELAEVDLVRAKGAGGCQRGGGVACGCRCM